MAQPPPGVPPALRGGPERARGLPRPTTAGDLALAEAAQGAAEGLAAPVGPPLRGRSAPPTRPRHGRWQEFAGDPAVGRRHSSSEQAGTMPSATLPAQRRRTGPGARQLGEWAVRVESPAGPQGPRPRDRSPQSGPRTIRLLGPPGTQRIPLGARAGAHRGRRAPEALRYAAGPPSCLGPRPTPSAAGPRHPPGAERTVPQAALVLPPGRDPLRGWRAAPGPTPKR